MYENSTLIRSVILDADASSCSRIMELCGRYSFIQIIKTFTDGKSSIPFINEHHPDLLISDVRLQDMSAFELLGKLRPVHFPQVIFVTQHAEYAIQAFECFAADYILKPLTENRFHLSILKLKDRIQDKANAQLQDKLNALFRYIQINQATHARNPDPSAAFIPVKRSGRIFLIQTRKIEYIVASGYYIEIYAEGKKHLVRDSLSNMHEKLSPEMFIRIHRSVIINLQYLREILHDGANAFSARMDNREVFKISRTYKKDVFDRVGL